MDEIAMKKIFPFILCLLTCSVCYGADNVFWGFSNFKISGLNITAPISVTYRKEPIKIEWDSVSGANSYELCIGAEDVSGSGDTVGVNCHVVYEGNSYTTTGSDLCSYAPGSQVWARVRSMLTQGNTTSNVSPWSPYLVITCSESLTSIMPTTTTTTAAVSDYVPNPFSFTPVVGATRSETYTSDIATLSGTDTPASITITQSTGSNALYSINGATYTSDPGNISNGDTLAVRMAASGSYSTTRCATLTVNGATQGVTGTYSVRTGAEPVTPPPSETYMFKYNGDFPSDTDKAYFSDGTDNKNGSLGGTASCDSNYCTILYSDNTHIQWAILGNDGINPEQGTMYFSLYYTDDNTNTTHEAGIIFEAYAATGDYLAVYKLATTGKMRFYYTGNATANTVTSYDSLSFNTWYRVGVAWDYNGANQDYLGIDVEPLGTTIDWDESSSNVAKTLVPLTSAISVINFGESARGTLSTDGMRIKDVVILSGYQANDIY
jgi:hypothetical protein